MHVVLCNVHEESVNQAVAGLNESLTFQLLLLLDLTPADRCLQWEVAMRVLMTQGLLGPFRITWRLEMHC